VSDATTTPALIWTAASARNFFAQLRAAGVDPEQAVGAILASLGPEELASVVAALPAGHRAAVLLELGGSPP
jgi:hypothetical protein